MTKIFQDRFGRIIRLTLEREIHILRHPEMAGQMDKLEETLQDPDIIIRSQRDPHVHLYHRHYSETSVTEKHLLVAIKIEESDAFVLTAFFTDTVKKGEKIWGK